MLAQVCYPKGTMKSRGEGEEGGYRTAFDDSSFLHLALQVHMLGRNLGFGLSGDMNNAKHKEYGDWSGMVSFCIPDKIDRTYFANWIAFSHSLLLLHCSDGSNTLRSQQWSQTRLAENVL